MLFEDWCEIRRADSGKDKRLWRLVERAGGRKSISDRLPDLIRSHYDELERISEDVRSLGYPAAAAILSERLPQSTRLRSGELGEILATELVEEMTRFVVPIRRLRYKDGREVPLRGDDLIGIHITNDGNLFLLKGEAKSRTILGPAAIAEARKALTRDAGRPTAVSLLFIADQLMASDDERGKILREEVATRAVPRARLHHMLFTMSGNQTPAALAADLASADDGRTHIAVHLRITDHQEFIRTAYEGALTLGND